MRVNDSVAAARLAQAASERASASRGPPAGRPKAEASADRTDCAGTVARATAAGVRVDGPQPAICAEGATPMQTFETSADDSDTEVRLRLMKVRMREVGGWVGTPFPV